MFNEYLMNKYARAYQEERLKEVEIYRLIKQSRIGRPDFQDRFLLGISDSLISFGQWLQARYDPKIASRYSIEQSCSGNVSCAG